METPEDLHLIPFNTYEVYLMELAGSTQNNKKIIETPNELIRTKNLAKN
jgi:hypothetical protein